MKGLPGPVVAGMLCAVANCSIGAGCGSDRSPTSNLGTTDSGSSESGTPESGTPESGTSESGVSDAGEEDAAPPPQDAGCTSLSWSRVAASPPGLAITGSGPSDIWLIASPPPDSGPVMGGSLMRGDGKTWLPVSLPGCQPPPYPMFGSGVDAVWVTGPNDVLAAGCTWDNGNMHHWDGSTWTTVSIGDTRWVFSLWGTAKDDVWGAGGSGDSYLGHWNGTSWVHVDSIHAGHVGGGARGDFWAGLGELEHHAADGTESVVALSTLGINTTSECSPQTDECVTGVWASATDDVWAVAVGGRILHFDGASWSVASRPTTRTLRGVWGTSRRDVWVVGDGGALFHFDGRTWSAAASPTTSDLAGVWASGPCDVWAIGDAVYHVSPTR